MYLVEMGAVIARWEPSNGGPPEEALVYYNAEDVELGVGIDVIARQHTMRYPAVIFEGLDNGEAVTVDGAAYVVRTVTAINDGAEKVAVLGRMDEP